MRKPKIWADQVKAVSTGEHYLGDGFYAVKLMDIATGRGGKHLWRVLDTVMVARSEKGIIKQAAKVARLLHVPVIPGLKAFSPVRKSEVNQILNYVHIERKRKPYKEKSR